MIKKLFLAGIPAILLSNQFETTLQDEMQWLEEETYVVSASRVKESIKKTPASVTVIDDEMIAKMGAKSIFDIFKTVPGMDVSQSNVYIDKISVRGVQSWFSEKVLILLDGHSLNADLLNGGATGIYKELPIELIKRVEIVQGPASALYGENAFVALINIITKKAEDIDGTVLTLKGGSDEVKIANLYHGKKYGNISVSLNLNAKGENDKRYVASDAGGNSGKTNPDIESVNTYLSILHNSGLYYTSSFNYTKDKQRYGVTNLLNDTDVSKKKVGFVELGYKSELTNKIDIHARIYKDRFEGDNMWLVASPNTTLGVTYTTEKAGTEALFTFHNDNYRVISGVSYEKQQVKDTTQSFNGAQIATFIESHSRDFKAVFGELLYDVTKDLRVNTGVRYDKFSDFGSTVNPRVGSTYSFNNTNSMKLMYGEAFRAPTFAELHNINNSVLLGNPDLEPEKVKTTEFTYLNSGIKNTELSFTLFKSEIDNMILSNGGQYKNLSEIETSGGKAEIKYDMGRGSYLLAHYSYQNPIDKATDKNMHDISKHMGYTALNYRIDKKFNLYIDAKYKGEQTRVSTSNKTSVDSSIISNATLSIKDLGIKGLNTKLVVNNIFDEKTYDTHTNTDYGWEFDYPVGDRSFFVELSYKF